MSKRAQRIVTLLASGTEIVCKLGLGDQLVGISHECDYPTNILDRPRLTKTRVTIEASSRTIDDEVKAFSGGGQSLYEIDESTIASLRPDVIVTQSQCEVCAVNYADVARLCQSNDTLADTTLVPLNPTTLEGIYDDITRVASACGIEADGSACIDELKGRVDGIREKARRLEKPRVLCLEWLDPVMVAANWLPELVELAGGESVLGHAGERSRYAEWESVAASGAEVIVLMPCGFDLQRTVAEAQVLKTLPGWDELPAVRNGQVFVVDANAFFTRPGPRIVDSLEILAHLIHPEMFHPVATDRPAYGQLV